MGSRGAYDRERLHRHEGHHCAARLIQVENSLEAKYEQDHHRALLAKSYYDRNTEAYAALRTDITALVNDTDYKPSLLSAFTEGLDSIIEDHVSQGQRRGRKLWKSIVDDEKDAAENEKSLQKDI